MSVTAATIRSSHISSNPSQGKQSLGSPGLDYVATKKRKEDTVYNKNNSNNNNNNKSNGANLNDSKMASSPLATPPILGKENTNNNSTSNLHSNSSSTDSVNMNNLSSNVSSVPTSSINGGGMYTVSQLNGGHNMNGNSQAHISSQSHYQNASVNGGMNGNSVYSQQNSVDPTAPLPNEIFDLLNDFWRPNELVAPDTHLLNGKFSRRSPEGSLDETAEEEKDGEDDITSLADNDMAADRTTQKRRYSRLSDGYERLKGVLPTVKDKRRVSKARILDEAINYIQRLESITSVLKREHEKRLSMLNGSNGFFPDYSVQPYMRALFQKQAYTQGPKISSYGGKNCGSGGSSLSKSPRLKQYNQSYSSQQQSMAGISSSNMGSVGGSTDYNYNNIGGSYNGSSLYQSTNEQMMNGEASPISNASPYSACSLSPGSTPVTYQNGSAAVNSSWPYQSMTHGYDASQMSSYNRQGSTGSAYASSNPYSAAMNGSMWGGMGNGGIGDTSSQVVQPTTADHSMKVG